MFKQLLLLTLIIFSTFQTFSQTTQRPKIALVLSGGGAKGFAHVGVLKVLEQEGIPIDMIVGTSIGSIVGGLYAIGYTADDIAKLAIEGNWPEFLSDYVPRRELNQLSKTEQQRYVITLPVADNKFPGLPSGMVNGQNVMNLFCGLTANIADDCDFSKLPIPFACVGTDLETGKEVVMTHGFLPTAIFSSMAIPGVFAPGQHNGFLLTDGGLANNFPTDVAKKMGADIIIGVDLRKDLYTAEELVSLNKLSNQIINFYSLQKDSINRSLCDIIIRPDITGYNTSSFFREAVDTLMLRGIASANEVLGQLRDLKQKYHLQPKPPSRHLIEKQAWKITNIVFSGNYSMSEKLLADIINKEIPGTYTYDEIKKSINSLYGLGVFKRVYFKLKDNEKGKTLHIYIEEGKAWNVHIGMRLNTRSGISVILNSTRKDYTKTFGLLSFTADISANPRFSALAELDKKNLPKIAVRADGAYNDMTVHANQDSYFQARLYTGSLKLYTYQPILNYSIVGVGVKEEYLSGNIYNQVGPNNNPNLIINQDILMTHFYGYYDFDNLNDFYFPTKGSSIYSEFSLTKDLIFNILNPIWLLKARSAVPIRDNMTLMAHVYARTLFSDAPLHLNNYLAAKDYELRFNHHLPFYGLPTLWATDKNALIGCLEFRTNIYKQHHLTLAANLLLHHDEFNQFKDYKSIWGFGLTYAFKSPVGPMEFTLGYSDNYQKLVASANLGFWF